MIYDASLLQRGKPYTYHGQNLIFSHASTLCRGSKSFTFRNLRGAWKHLSRNQLREVSPVEPMREGFWQ